MLRTIPLILCALIFFTACKKKKSKEEEEEPVPEEIPVVTVPDTGLKCQALPPAPEPFGWKDTTGDENKNINAFLFNPVNNNEILCVVNGDAFGKNKLFNYNILTKQALYLATLGDYLPQINKDGWIVYSDLTNCVFKIKADGTGFKQLTFEKRSHHPAWDHTGKYIFYYAEEVFNVKPQLYKIDTSGNLLAAFETEIPYYAVFKNSNKLIWLKTSGNLATLVLKDLSPQGAETDLISGPLYSKPGRIYFDNMTLDHTDENLYWSNSNGIYRCNLASKKVDTLFRNCENMIFDNPMMSFKPGELTYGQHVKIPLNSLYLSHRYKAMELNLNNGRSTEIRVFP